MIKNSFQILITDKPCKIPPLIQEAIKSFQNSLPNTSYKLYNKEMIEELLQTKFDNEVVNSFHKLKPKAFKADLARYCIGYVYGGWYADITIKMIKSINDFQKNINFLGFVDLGENIKPFTLPYPIQSSLFYVAKESKIMEKAIDIIIRNCKEEYYGITATSPTGPGVLGRSIAYFGLEREHVIGHFMPLTPNHINKNRSYILPDGTILALHKDAWLSSAKAGQISEFGIKDSDNYLELYNKQDIYNSNLI